MALKELLLTDTSPAAASTVASTTGLVTGLDQFDWFTIDALLLGGTGGTLDVYVQRWIASLNEWRDWLHFAQLAAGATARYVVDSSWGQSGVVTVGQGTSPAIAVATQANLHPGSRARLLFVAGASTSAGAVQKVVLSGWRKR
jgi:hypothetical protein